MSANTKLFAAALGQCGLSIVGAPLPAKPDKFTDSVENSITLHVLAHGQDARTFPWHLMKMLTVYSMATTDAQGQTSVSGTPYHGVLTMNTKDRVQLGLCQKHFKPLEATPNGMLTKGCAECNAPPPPRLAQRPTVTAKQYAAQLGSDQDVFRHMGYDICLK